MTVLACIDYSESAKSVCEYAAQAAIRLRCGVDVVHAIGRESRDAEGLRGRLRILDRSDRSQGELRDISAERSRQVQQQARAVLQTASQRLRDLGVADVREQLVLGELMDALQAFHDDARLIVLGRQGEQYEAGGRLGSNLERVVRAVRSPLLIVPRAIREVRRFVVAYDASENARKMIDTLTSEPFLLDAACDLLMVEPETLEHWEQLDLAASQLIEAGYRIRVLLKQGEPADVILDTVREVDADLMVMGAYSHFRLRERLIGSTTSSLIRNIRVPLLNVR